MKLRKLSSLNPKGEILTKFRLLLQPYAIRKKCWRVYFSTIQYPYGFPDHLCHLFFSVFYNFSPWQSVSSYYCRYQ